MALDEKKFGARAKDFRFPKPAYSDDNAFTGRDIIQPVRFERKHAGDKPIPQRKMLKGRLQKLGQIRPGQGPSGLTHALYGLDGTNPVPTRFGAGRHVLEDWRPGDSFEDTAMWTPEEALIAKSYSDEYIDFVKQFDSSDEFLYECAGKGIAFQTDREGDRRCRDQISRFDGDAKRCGGDHRGERHQGRPTEDHQAQGGG